MLFNRLYQTNRFRFAALSAVISTCATINLHAEPEIIGGVNFPEGAISFADAVVSYTPHAGGATPSAANNNPTKAIGAPQVKESTAIGPCTNMATCPFVSLGDGGSIVLMFTDNYLTGSDSDDIDLRIYEVGPDVEDTHVEISQDGSEWFSVGTVHGSISGIDIDTYGFDSKDRFSYVRLTDDTYAGYQAGPSVGADIDAIGAISTVAKRCKVARCHDKDCLERKRKKRKTRICHLPPHNPSNERTVRVNISALDRHMEHGDYLGKCIDDDHTKKNAKRKLKRRKKQKMESKVHF